MPTQATIFLAEDAVIRPKCGGEEVNAAE